MGSALQFIGKGSMLAGTFIDGIGNAIMDVVGSVLWLFCDIFFVILDMFESLFTRLAGISSDVTNANGEAIEGDLVLYLIKSDLVQQIFLSILILSFILLVIFTIFAIVKNMYAEKQEPVSKIINSSVKALLMYLLVPVATVVCLIVGNVVLQAIDGATKATSTGGVSDMLFMSAAYNANRLRCNTEEENEEQLIEMITEGNLWGIQTYLETNYSIDFSNPKNSVIALDNSDFAEIAAYIDDQFTAQTLVNEWQDKWNFITINNYYRGYKISFITVWIGGAFLIWAIGKICWGLVARLFKMTLYFALSPAVMATFPIDGGKVLGSWRGEMVKNGTMAYCAVGVLNVLYSVLPFFNDIRLWGTGDVRSWLANQILKLFLYIIAFSSAQKLIETVSGWFGTGNALAEGIATKKTVGEQLKKRTVQVAGAFYGFKGGRDKAKQLDKNGGKGLGDKLRRTWGGVLGAYQGSGMADAGPGIAKVMDEIKGKKKAGGEYYEKYATTLTFHNKDNEAMFKAQTAIKEQSDAIKKQIDALDAAFAKRVADEGMVAGSAEYNAWKDTIDKQKQKVKASADFLKPLFEAEDKALEVMKQNLDDRKNKFKSVNVVFKGQDQDRAYKTQIDNALALSGVGPLSDADWQQLKQGNLSVVPKAGRGAANRAYKRLANQIQDNDKEIASAMQDVQDLYNSGAEGQNYLQGVFGTSFTGAIDVARDRAHYITEKNAINTASQNYERRNDAVIGLKNVSFDNQKNYNAAEIKKIADSIKK